MEIYTVFNMLLMVVNNFDISILCVRKISFI